MQPIIGIQQRLPGHLTNQVQQNAVGPQGNLVSMEHWVPQRYPTHQQVTTMAGQRPPNALMGGVMHQPQVILKLLNY